MRAQCPSGAVAMKPEILQTTLGRSAIAELLDLSDRIRGMILDRRPASEIKKAAKEEGMTFLRESALKKVMEGKTTLREINKVTFVE